MKERISSLTAMLFSTTVTTVLGGDPSGGLARTPPMGWMSWELFRCNVDCDADPANCIGERLYEETATALAAAGFLAAGYDTVHIDDCWETLPGRNASGFLSPNATRFPSGFEGPNGLGAYFHSKGLKFGLYSDEGAKTCGGYPGSKGNEALDARTFAAWGVDYLKLDGCYNQASAYQQGYSAMGKALRSQDRPIVYSCSWPAYLGSNETAKPWASVIAAGCNLWRNWDDIQCNWKVLPRSSSILAVLSVSSLA